MTAAALRARMLGVVQRALYHLPLHPERARAAELRALRRSARAPLAELRARQWRRLTELCAHAATVPFHAARMRGAGWHGPAPRDAEEFARLPVLTSADVRREGEALRAPGSRSAPISITTSGSTGAPRTLYFDRATASARAAANTFLDEWAGYRIGCRVVLLWGGGAALREARARERRSRLRERLALALAPHDALWLPIYDLSEETLRSYCRRIAEFRPDVVVSYAGTLETLARTLATPGMPAVRPRTVISSSEVLGHRRRVIEGAFGCPVFDRYGAREVGVIAAECTRHDGLHVNVAHLNLEIVDEAGRPLPAGASGSVVVTDLRNREMPLLRYSLGDHAAHVDGECGCGLSLPRITPIEGRDCDVVLFPSGRRVADALFCRALESEAAVRQFRVTQREPDRLVVELDAPGLSEARVRALRETLTAWFAPEMRVEVTCVERILPTAGGKYPVIDSPVARAALAAGEALR